MRKLLAISILFALGASAQTVINYADGSTYTLPANQEIYITTSNKTLFDRKLYSNGNIYFTAQKPWPKRDYIPEETDGMRTGSHEWCTAYIPWSEGYTFDMQSWQRLCDTNRDGVYDEEDDGWQG